MCSAKPNSSKVDTSMGTRDAEQRMRGAERAKKKKKTWLETLATGEASEGS